MDCFTTETEPLLLKETKKNPQTILLSNSYGSSGKAVCVLVKYASMNTKGNFKLTGSAYL
jgi:hypothetical protein